MALAKVLQAPYLDRPQQDRTRTTVNPRMKITVNAARL
jgi:hypothetical protein